MDLFTFLSAVSSEAAAMLCAVLVGTVIGTFIASQLARSVKVVLIVITVIICCGWIGCRIALERRTGYAGVGAIYETSVASVEQAFDLEEGSRVTAPPELFYGGILRDYNHVDLKSLDPALIGLYHAGENEIFWSYSFRPMRFFREGRKIWIKGESAEKGRLYFVMLSKRIVGGATAIGRE